MMTVVAYLLAAAAIAVMAVNTVLAVRLMRRLVGGEVGQKWTLLTGLIAVFFLGYLASPLAIYFSVPLEYLNLMVFSVFLFGAVFVFVVIGIVRDTLTFMRLLK